MAGHSKFKNIMHRKGAQDKKRAKIFSRLGREISVSVKEGGPDPEKNIRLRSAIGSAKSLNMPKDNIERAIKKGEGNDADSNYEEVRYEGYGPDGVAIIVEALTNNKNRTAAEVRSAFSKYGGNLGETGSVSFGFKRLGNITINKDNINGLIWKSENDISVSKDKADTLFKLLNILEENEDVQAVSSNFDVTDDILASLTA
jgi:YebC/PmpR family DNA-binding regulatory protein